MAVCCCGWTHCVDLWQCKRDCSFGTLDNKKRCNWWLASTLGLLFLWLRKLWHGRCNTAFILQRIPLFAPHCPALPRVSKRQLSPPPFSRTVISILASRYLTSFNCSSCLLIAENTSKHFFPMSQEHYITFYHLHLHSWFGLLFDRIFCPWGLFIRHQ